MHYPSTRFYGSKRQLVPQIERAIGSLGFDTVLDVFGGTATVSLMMSDADKSVTFHDGFNFQTKCAAALLRNDQEVWAENDVASWLNAIEPVQGFISQEFSGYYFTNEENSWLDGFLSALTRLEGNRTHDALFYAVSQACLKKRPFNLFHRKNLYLRSDDVTRKSLGNHYTWRRPFAETALMAYHELLKARSGRTNDVEVLAPSSVFELPTGFDCVYIDPPYIPKNRSVESYSTKYHFLEGMSRSSAWDDLIDRRTKTKQLKRPYFCDDFESAANGPTNLSKLLERHRDSVVLLSYGGGGQPPIERLHAEMQRYFQSVRVTSFQRNRALSKNKIVEFLLIGEPAHC